MLFTCIEPYEPEIGKYENLLVVEGAISNIPGSAFVKLSKTSRYNEQKIVYINAAKVTITDDQNNIIRLKNTAKGLYTAVDAEFCGEIGRSYKLTVETADGIICESTMDRLNEPIDLDAVKYSFKDGENDSRKGLQILLDVENKDNLNAYFYWEYTETWEFEVPFISSLKPEARICYKIYTPPVFNIGSTAAYSDKQLTNYPLYFIDNTTNRLYIKYSVLVTQHTLTEQTYLFYHNLKEINENRGSLFDTYPITLEGNMRNLSHPENPVLGNFLVSGASTKRLFIKNIEIRDKLTVPSGYDRCDIRFGGMMSDGAYLDSLIKAGWIVFEKAFNSATNDTVLSLSNYRGCFDCTKDGTIVKPDFWDIE